MVCVSGKGIFFQKILENLFEEVVKIQMQKDYLLRVLIVMEHLIFITGIGHNHAYKCIKHFYFLQLEDQIFLLFFLKTFLNGNLLINR